ncbi:NADH:flavin oxidoreductase [Sphaerochaeta pleomorpha str. Grapes]|uniref:NADH:flavin oxidoreductase n=1 Tax=Sphaerochaeta pleomorpha (strain ATCC BAA-1885 / DSM 22778 / Grapes) TaxID=158190 RepID=G8QSE4_SPHPG|nr:NADPH dehydrogenase [Sphaerochaeta pleomorpha]AEV30074.1 NADH:flavin oxidoreductase [Sphaerochaeta pleomorpha str. Grapes]
MKLFDSFFLKHLELRNRLVMPPMCTYQAQACDGKVTPFHQAHYLAPAIGGVGLVIVEATAVAPEGRISDYDLGLWCDGQISGLRSLVEGVHATGAKIAIQLGHAGRKCEATNGVSSILGPSPLAYDDSYRIPEEMDEKTINRVIDEFKQAARRAEEAGFDAIEIHAAHGYLINQFISPATNKRSDQYKEPSLFLSQVLQAVHATWPVEKPLWVRVSATDYSPDGYDVTYCSKVLAAIKPMIDAVHVSSGGVVPIVPPVYPGYQIAFARTIGEAVDLPVIAVGMLSSPDLAEYALQSGFADLVAVGRGLLRNPNWLLEIACQHQKDFLLQQPMYLQRGFPLH